MKKIIAILLVTTMFFSVCTMAVFADFMYTYTEDEDNSNSNVDSFYHDSNINIRAEGCLIYYYENKLFTAVVSCRNLQADAIENIHLFVQCAINYTDGSQDFYTASNHVTIEIDGEEAADIMLVIPSDKTVESFDAEFFIWHEDEPLWEGMILHVNA